MCSKCGPPIPCSHFKDLYVVYELMDTDLHQIIRSPQPLSDDHCQYFLYQVCFHSAGIAEGCTHACLRAYA